MNFTASADTAAETASALDADLYDFPKYYDLIFGSDWRAEFDFLEGCFERHAERTVRRLFEPACGTGRLLIKFAQAGYEVSGLDLNSRAVDYCNRRLALYHSEPAACVGGMSKCRLRRRAGAAFNTINSFRHLPDERAAENHLAAVAEALAPGGIYVLGLHLTPADGTPGEAESWSARRGNLAVVTHMWSEGVDLRRRVERVGMHYDVYTPTSTRRIRNMMDFRTYTARQIRALFRRVPALEVVETYDFGYDLDRPIHVDAYTEDVVFVLRRVG